MPELVLLLPGKNLMGHEPDLGGKPTGQVDSPEGGTQDSQLIVELTEAIRHNSTNAELFARRGQAYLAAGREDLAEIDLTDALLLDPENPAWHLARGKIRVQLNKLELALADFTGAAQLDPFGGEAYLGQGIVALAREENVTALKRLSCAIQFSPNLAEAYYQRARCHYRFEDCDAGIEDASRALELDPAHSLARRLRAELFFRVGLAEAAHADYTKLIENAPLDPIMYHLRGKLDFRRGLYEDAVIDLTAALELDPKFARALADRGSAYRALSKHREALTDLTAAVHQDTKYAAEYLVQMGIVRGSQGEFDGAIADFLVALKLDPSNRAAIRGKELVTQLRETHGASVAGRSFAGRTALHNSDAWRSPDAGSVVGPTVVGEASAGIGEVIKAHPETEAIELDLSQEVPSDPDDVLQNIEAADVEVADALPKTDPLPGARPRVPPMPTREEITRQVARETSHNVASKSWGRPGQVTSIVIGLVLVFCGVPNELIFVS